MNRFTTLSTFSAMLKKYADELYIKATASNAPDEIKALHKLFVNMHAITPTTEFYALTLINNMGRAKKVKDAFFAIADTKVITPAQKQVSDTLRVFLDDVVESLPVFYESLPPFIRSLIPSVDELTARIISIKASLFEKLNNYEEPRAYENAVVERASSTDSLADSRTTPTQESTIKDPDAVAAIALTPIEPITTAPATPSESINTDSALASPKAIVSQNILQRTADRTGPMRHRITKDNSGTIIAAIPDSLLKRSANETGPKKYRVIKEGRIVKSATLIATSKPAISNDTKLSALYDRAGQLFTQYYEAYIAANKASWNPLHGKTGRDNATQARDQFMSSINKLDASLTHDQHIEQMILTINAMHKIYNVSGNRKHSFKNYLNKFKQDLEALKENKTEKNVSFQDTASTATTFLTRFLCLGQSNAANTTATPNS